MLAPKFERHENKFIFRNSVVSAHCMKNDKGKFTQEKKKKLLKICLRVTDYTHKRQCIKSRQDFISITFRMRKKKKQFFLLEGDIVILTTCSLKALTQQGPSSNYYTFLLSTNDNGALEIRSVPTWFRNSLVFCCTLLLLTCCRWEPTQ